MAGTPSRKIFVNLPVRDLKASMEFFSGLGFEFNPQFTDDKAACMIVSQEASVMLLREPFFKTFTKKHLCATATATEGILALSCASRAEVDEMVRRAVAAGGSHAMEPMDQGFMYGWSFYDLDGHHWEVLWMDPTAIERHSRPRGASPAPPADLGPAQRGARGEAAGRARPPPP